MEQLGQTEQQFIIELGCIYKITSKTENKSYIGQCHLAKKKEGKPYLYGPRGRWSDHKADALTSKDRDFLNAIRRLGPDDFNIDVLTVRPYDELSDLEIYYIAYENTIQPHGYNMAQGGINKHNNVPITIRSYYSEETIIRFCDSLLPWLQQMLDDKHAHIIKKHQGEAIVRIRVALASKTGCMRSDGSRPKYKAVMVYIYDQPGKHKYQYSFGGVSVSLIDAYKAAVNVAVRLAPNGVYDDQARSKLGL